MGRGPYQLEPLLALAEKGIRLWEKATANAEETSDDGDGGDDDGNVNEAIETVELPETLLDLLCGFDHDSSCKDNLFAFDRSRAPSQLSLRTLARPLQDLKRHLFLRRRGPAALDGDDGDDEGSYGPWGTAMI